MNRKIIKTGHALFIVIAFYALLSVINLGRWGVLESSEARYAEISREMLRSGDWVHPTLLGIHHYHKPPVTYWLTAAGYKLLGVNSLGARFFLAVSYLVQIALVYTIISAITKDEKTSLYGAVIYSSLPLVLVSVRGLTTDAYLNTFILASMACWLTWRSSSKSLWLYLTAFFLGVAFLTKGPVALLIPVFVFIGLRSLNNNQPPLTLHHLLASVLFITIAGSWFFELFYENKLFIEYFLFRHTIDRFAHAEAFSRAKPWWFYIVYMPVLALPWTIVLIYGFRSVKRDEIPVSIKKVITFWILMPLAFFSLSSSKLVLYGLPVFTGVAMVYAWCLRVMRSSFINQFELILFVWVNFVCILLVAAPYFLQYTLSTGLIILSVGFILIIYLIKTYAPMNAVQRALAYSTLFSGYLMLFSSVFIYENGVKLNSTEPIARWIKDHGLKDRQIMVYNQLLPSLAFELDKDIISLNNGNKTLNRELQFQNTDGWKNLLLDLKNPATNIPDSLLAKPGILLVKGTLDGNSQLLKGFSKKTQFDKWTLYCNSD